MRARLKQVGAVLAVSAALSVAAYASDQPALRVCADPNNLPYSNAQRAGFENRIVELIARDLGRKVTYEWWAQRRGNVRETLNAGKCDVIAGIASGLEMLATTRPYYRSVYVFVTRADRDLQLDSFDDPRLRQLTVGVQMIGDDFSNTPPAHALARRGAVGNIRGYMVYGDYATDSPTRTIIDDVGSGRLDVATVWGPIAGYFAGDKALRIAPVHPLCDMNLLPMTFAVSMGVRKQDQELRAALDAALVRREHDIVAILDEYRVPRVPLELPRCGRPEREDDD